MVKLAAFRVFMVKSAVVLECADNRGHTVIAPKRQYCVWQILNSHSL